MSAYLILEREGDTWREQGLMPGASALAAVRAYVELHKTGGVFLAIPERSAKTIRVKVETVQKVSVDAGDDEQ